MKIGLYGFSGEGKSHLSESIMKSLSQAIEISEVKKESAQTKFDLIGKTRYCPVCGEKLREAKFSDDSWIYFYGMVCDNDDFMWTNKECIDVGEVVVFYDEFLKRNL
jgi:ABC-type dipeptide/oligopeptide/nickel transport system ATPase component